MKYKCVIVDDEKLARELLEAYVEQLPNFELVAACSSAIEASEVLNQNKVDLLFLDIEMPVLKGTDFFKTLQYKPAVIFTTAYRDYAIEGFDLNAVDYLLKPIVFERFFKAVQKFIDAQKVVTDINSSAHKEHQKNFIFITKGRKQIKILFNDVLYIESLKDYIKIHVEQETITVKHKISELEKKLDDRFIRTHRSYIVNSHKITAYTKHDIEINAFEVPIGGNYKEMVLKSIDKIS